MKTYPKAAIFRLRAILFLGCCFAMTACADMRGPQWLTGEPDESVLNAPRVVATPKGAARQEWPNLSEVPETKPNFSDPVRREEKAVDLKSENLKARAEMERIRNIQTGPSGMAERTSQTDDTP